MFSGVSLTVLQLQFINIGSLRYVISLLKQISSEDFVSKSQLILITSISVASVFRLWFGKQVQPTLGEISVRQPVCRE
jgi:hypothetical protein